ncbi:hypothetical protein MBLNU459_g1023t1 [Dothideomycetes sp. NU459]
MPQDGSHDTTKESAAAATGGDRSDWRDMFAVPEAAKRVFGKFPLVTYAPNQRPLRAPARRDAHTLYIWTTAAGADEGDASFNPTCLKWQTYLKFCGIAFCTVPSTNHASPTGMLPFLLPATPSASASDAASPVASGKLKTWAQQHAASPPAEEDKAPLRAELYGSLVDHAIRRAWLWTLYLEPANAGAVAHRLYVAPASASALVNLATARQLRAAAHDELATTTRHQSAAQLLEQARAAFAALSQLLAGDEWFSAGDRPGLFDASVFAYTHLLLDERMGWQRNELAESLRTYPNLVGHRDRVLSLYF